MENPRVIKAMKKLRGKKEVVQKNKKRSADSENRFDNDTRLIGDASRPASMMEIFYVSAEEIATLDDFLYRDTGMANKKVERLDKRRRFESTHRGKLFGNVSGRSTCIRHAPRYKSSAWIEELWSPYLEIYVRRNEELKCRNCGWRPTSL